MGTVLVRHLPSDVGDPRIDVARITTCAVYGGSDSTEQGIGQLERVPPGNVEAVKKSIPDKVQISRRGRADVPAKRRQFREDLAWFAGRVEEGVGQTRPG